MDGVLLAVAAAFCFMEINRLKEWS